MADKEKNWNEFLKFIEDQGYVKNTLGDYCKEEIEAPTFFAELTFPNGNSSGNYRFKLNKHSVRFEREIGIGKWIKLNSDTFYIKDFAIIQEGEKISFKKRNG